MANSPARPADGPSSAIHTRNTLSHGTGVRIHLMTDDDMDEPYLVLVDYSDTIGICGWASVVDPPTLASSKMLFPWTAISSVVLLPFTE